MSAVQVNRSLEELRLYGRTEDEGALAIADALKVCNNICRDLIFSQINHTLKTLLLGNHLGPNAAIAIAVALQVRFQFDLSSLCTEQSVADVAATSGLSNGRRRHSSDCQLSQGGPIRSEVIEVVLFRHRHFSNNWIFLTIRRSLPVLRVLETHSKLLTCCITF